MRIPAVIAHGRRTVAGVWLLVWTALRVDRVRAPLVLLLAPLLGATSVMQGLALQWMIDGAADRALFLRGALLLAGVTVAIFQIGAIGADLRLVLQQRIGLELDRRLMATVSGHVDLSRYQDPDFLDQLELLRQRRGELGAAFAALVENGNVLARFVAAAVLLGLANPVLAVLPLFVLPLVWASHRLEQGVAEAERETAELDRRRVDLFSLGTCVAAARELRVYRLGSEIADRHRRVTDIVRRRRDAARTRGTVAVVLAWALFVVALVAAIGLVAESVRGGSASAGQAVLVVVLGVRVTAATAGLTMLVAWLRRCVGTARLYRRVVGGAASPRTGSGADFAVSGDLVLENVSFHYPGRPTSALSGVDLRLPAGSTVAVVGDNGAGKSTLVALLAGLYRPSSGRITYAGRDLSDVDAWRSDVTACFQDFCRFELVLREAIGVGDLAAVTNQPRVASALHRCGPVDWVTALPSGWETQLGRTFPDGTDLSVGQWQQVALARARMRPRPRLVLLDEPAASLDPLTEAALIEHYLDGPRGNRTAGAVPGPITVIVSHRLSSARSADLIVVLDEGRVVECGTHADLIEREGRYAHTYALHAAAYRPARTSALDSDVRL